MCKTLGFLEIRFDDGILEARNRLWNVLCNSFFQQFVRQEDSVLDMGAGYCEFINNIRCRKKYALDVDESPMRYARKDVQVLIGESTNVSQLLKEEEVDVVFMSNFLEHIPTKDKLVLTLEEIRKILKPDGKLLMLQPNIRYCYKNYWDYFDHHIPLSDKSMEEVLKTTHFTIRMIKPKFLPLTTKSRLPLNSWLVKLYLKIPLAQLIMGKQMFIYASKS